MADQLTPFMLNETPVRGRIIRLSDSVSAILNQHNYPEPVSRLLAEALCMAAILSSNLKHDGIISLQLQSKGALSLLVADATDSGHLRGYAQFEGEVAGKSLSQLCPEGYLVITLDPGAGGKRYQGVVPLEGETIAESMQHYFQMSQQLMVECSLAVGQETTKEGTHWIAGGIYIEHIPESAEASEEDEIWREAKMLLHTVRDDELLDRSLPQEELLFRLFHETGVWKQESVPIIAQCRCSREKIEKALQGMERSSLQELADESGDIPVDCQFCGQREVFTLAQLSFPESGQEAGL